MRVSTGMKAALWLLVVAAAGDFLAKAWHAYGVAGPETYGMFWSRRGWLWAHLAGGTLTLALGPWQFVAAIRARFTAWHRWLGRTYLGALLVGFVGAAGLIATSAAPPSIRIAFAATELAWVFTAAMGLVAIRRGHVAEHRRWMIRNYIVTFVFVSFRAASMVPALMALGPPSLMIPLLLWLGWTVPMATYEALRRRRVTAPGRPARWAQPAASTPPGRSG